MPSSFQCDVVYRAIFAEEVTVYPTVLAMQVIVRVKQSAEMRSRSANLIFDFDIDSLPALA
jgi:hypothetical protein